MGSMCLRIKERIHDDIFTYKQTKIEGQGFMKSLILDDQKKQVGLITCVIYNYGPMQIGRLTVMFSIKVKRKRNWSHVTLVDQFDLIMLSPFPVFPLLFKAKKSAMVQRRKKKKKKLKRKEKRR